MLDRFAYRGGIVAAKVNSGGNDGSLARSLRTSRPHPRLRSQASDMVDLLEAVSGAVDVVSGAADAVSGAVENAEHAVVAAFAGLSLIHI